MMKIPSDVFLDFVNNEMWVASFGNHLALAYKLGASGDTAPIRIIRGSPLNTTGTMISNPFAVAYDTKREEILVTSCVAHPRIAAFPRTADKNALPVRIDRRREHQDEPHHARHPLRRGERRDRGAVATPARRS